MGKDERKDKEDCVTIADFRDRLEEIREGDDRVWDDDDEDDRDEESNEDEGARGEDEEESDEDHDLNDEEKSELFAVIGELKEACENGDEAACVELRELVEEHWGDWERDDEDRDWEQKDGDDSRCVPKHMLHHMKEKFGRDRGHKDYERDLDEDDEEWEELRAVMAELGEACDEGDEIACEELEELITELENDEQEREKECDERDDDESDEEDQDEDDSEDDDPENT